MKSISLITMSHGNPIALKRTFDSFKGICDEIVYGDLCIFPEDSELIETYKAEFNLKIIKLPFDFIFKNGFSEVLNTLAEQSSNNMCLYANCSEVVDGEERAKRLINEMLYNYNVYAINHAVETHVWWRCWDKSELKWGGMIHEEIIKDKNELIQCPYFIFQFKDTEKDMGDELKAWAYNSIKEIVYFTQYIRLVEHPELIGITNEYWLGFAKDNYDSMKHRLMDKGRMYEAFVKGDKEMLLNAIYENKSFEKPESSTLINFQGNRKDIL